jgi:dTDP-4-dehydrorhamnose reductase|tara:strand:+ start:68 stop:961 length:894 start_codon:yes stop_codon:yes gene_type:complete
MKILILGADGMLGHKLFQMLGTDYSETYGTVAEKTSDPLLSLIPYFQTNKVIYEMNAMDFGRLKKIIEQVKPDCVINCLRVATHSSQKVPSVLNIKVNALLPHHLAKMTAEQGTRLIHFSSDCVFDGKRGMYSEEDTTNATHIYGQTRLLGEVCADNTLVLRGSVIGRELTGHSSLLDWFLRQQGGEINGFSRAIYSGLSSIETVRVVRMILKKNFQLTGLYNIASEPINKYNLLQLAKKSFGVDVIIQKEDNFTVDRSLNAEKFKAATKYIFPSWPKMMKELAKENEQYNAWGIKL